MSQLVSILVVLVSVTWMSPDTPLQSGAAGKSSAIHACSILTRDLVAKATSPANKYVLDATPEEEPAGQGSSCSYADLMVQIDPFARSEELRKSPGKGWQPVSGVGDTAYFHDNSGRYAEIMAWSGTHHFTIQVGVPTGDTAEKIKPNLIQLANAIIAKLK
jgi:hypothetical protein